MSLRKIKFTVAPSGADHRLDQILAEELPRHLDAPISKSFSRKLIIAGAVYLNRSRIRIASKILHAGAQIEVWLDEQALKKNEKTQARGFDLQPTDILFEDEDLIVVNKPAGLPTQPTLDQARQNLVALVKDFLKKRDSLVEPYLGMHHRLDRDTSGVILLTKSKRANPGIAAQFAEHRIQKVYQALCQGAVRTPYRVGYSWTVQNYLKKSTAPGKRNKMIATRAGGDFAKTRFTVVECGDRWAWIEAQPETGRMHQIRVHLADLGLPIIGDETYGLSDGFSDSFRTLLHAGGLTLEHPITKTPVRITCPIPQDFLKCLSQLRSPKTA